METFAKSVGKTSRAIKLAYEKGVFGDTVVLVNGKPKIADAARARQLYENHTRPKAGSGGNGVSAGYLSARASRETENARLAELKREEAELELAARKGELVPVAEVKAALAAEYAAVKSKLRAIPARAKAEISHLTAADVGLLKRMVDEALAELADEDVAE